MTKQELEDFLREEGILYGPHFKDKEGMAKVIGDKLNTISLSLSLNLDDRIFIIEDFKNTILILTRILKFSDARDKDLKLFLRARAILIRDTLSSYFSFRNSPVNELCIRLVEKLAQADEDLLPILLGQSLVKEYGITDETLRDLTESVVDGKRKLTLDGYLVSHDKNCVIPFKWYGFQSDKTAPNFNYYHLDQNGQTIPLTSDDLHTVRQLFGAESHALFTQLEFYQTLSKSSQTIYGLMMQLIEGLKKGAVDSNRDIAQITEANEFNAGQEAFSSQQEFFRVWKEIPVEIKNKVLELREKVYNADANPDLCEEDFNKAYPSLRECFLILRGHLEEDDPKYQDQLLIRERTSLINCADVISKTLRAIINNNTAAFEVYLTESKNDAVDFRDIYDKLMNKIKLIKHQEIAYPRHRALPDSDCRERYLKQFDGNPENMEFRSLEEIYFLIDLYGETKTKHILKNSQNFSSQTSCLLKQAMDRDNDTMMTFLVSAGINLKQTMPLKTTLLHFAIDNDLLYLAHTLLQREDITDLLFELDYENESPLLLALKHENASLIKAMLNIDPKKQLTTPCLNGLSLNYILLYTNKTNLLQLVFEHDYFKKNPTEFQALLKMAPFNDYSMLAWSILNEKINTAAFLIPYFDPGEFFRESGGKKTPIHIALDNKHISIIKLMIERCKSADLSALTRQCGGGLPPLNLAISLRYTEAIDLLVKADADNLETQSADGKTPIQNAVEIDFYPGIQSVLNEMLDRKYGFEALNKALNSKHGNKTALSMIIEQKDQALLTRLFKTGSDITATTRKRVDEKNDPDNNKRLKQ